MPQRALCPGARQVLARLWVTRARRGSALARLRLRLASASGFGFVFFLLIGFWFDSGLDLIWVGFGWIRFDFGLIRTLIALTALQEVLGS